MPFGSALPSVTAQISALIAQLSTLPGLSDEMEEEREKGFSVEEIWPGFPELLSASFLYGLSAGPSAGTNATLNKNSHLQITTQVPVINVHIPPMDGPPGEIGPTGQQGASGPEGPPGNDGDGVGPQGCLLYTSDAADE